MYSGYTSAYVQHVSLAGGAELEGAVDGRHDTVHLWLITILKDWHN